MDRDEAPVADWNKEALDALKGKLEQNVIINIGLNNKLYKAAGGFMKREEVKSVESTGSNAEQMARLIEILQGKTNADFKIFCRILRDSNWSAWADELEREARKFRSQSGEPPKPVDDTLPIGSSPDVEDVSTVRRGSKGEDVTDGPEKFPQFAIITANETEQNVVKRYLKLGDYGRVCKQLSAYEWEKDPFLKKKNVTITYNAASSEDSYDMFTIGKVMGVHIKCTRIGPGGAQDTISDLLKKAREKNWLLKLIFVVGCCGASMSDAKKTQKNWCGTVLLSDQMEDYFDTAKAEVGGFLPKPRTYTLYGDWVNWLSEKSICQPDVEEESQRDIPVERVDKYLSGPLVIKSEKDGDNYRGKNCQMAGIEMEGTGVYSTVCNWAPETKVAVVKGISDYAGSDKKMPAKSVVFGTETAEAVDDEARQEIATFHAITLVTRCVASKSSKHF